MSASGRLHLSINALRLRTHNASCSFEGPHVTLSILWVLADVAAVDDGGIFLEDTAGGAEAGPGTSEGHRGDVRPRTGHEMICRQAVGGARV